MPLKFKAFWLKAACLLALTAGLSAQAPAPAPAPQQRQTPPNFTSQIDLVTMDAIVRDEKGNFVSDLRKDEFEVFEDGVKQDISSMTLSHGGRVTNLLVAPPPPATEGIILPTVRPRNDISGRIFLFFVDDLHLQFNHTARVRDLFRRISKTLVHEGDMFAIVSTGPSSVAVDLTYDKKRLDEAMGKITGNELSPLDIINGANDSGGPTEVRHRAHVAFSTANDVLENLEKVHNRRKAFVYISDGYDFNPYQDARFGRMDVNSPFAQNTNRREENRANTTTQDNGQAFDPTKDPKLQQNQLMSENFADADLATELAEVTRVANRANATIYSIDPRGLEAMGDIGDQVANEQWAEFIQKSQDSLKVLADETGGFAIVNQNDMDGALKRIDADTSDYYVLGYYSTNPDPTKRRRKVEVRVTRNALNVVSRKEYVLRPPTAPPAAATSK